jgi:hypothetical protein
MEKTLFDDFGCVIVERDGAFFIRYDSGESAGSRLMESPVSADEVEKARRSERDAYAVIIAAQARGQAKPVD